MKKALISVYKKDKKLLEFVRFLKKKKYQIISTSGTYQYLIKNGNISSMKVSDITSFPEILDGRIKTIHPKIYGGILADRSNQKHVKSLHFYQIPFIDIVLIDFYPFLEKTKEFLSENDNSSNHKKKKKIFLNEFIDIGGPSILRSAAKNFYFVTAIIDQNDYEIIQNEIESYGFPTLKLRKKLAGKVFSYTSYYDSLISRFFLKNEKFPIHFHLSYERKKKLRYGENPHQKASFYVNSFKKGAMCKFNQLHGKDLSFNNLRDIDIAWKIVNQFSSKKNACCMVKHSTPCGVALGENIKESFQKTYHSDPISSFGGVMAINTSMSIELAKKINQIFIEVILAQDYPYDTLKVLQKKKNLRIIKMNNSIISDPIEYIQVDGGILVQESDFFNHNDFSYQTVTKKKISKNDLKSLFFAQKVVKYVKSNAIVIAKNEQTLGISGGQTSRILAAKQAIKRALEKDEKELVLVSDAFFPFRDIIEETARCGRIRSILQPGGSIRDKESIDACNEYGIAMAFTGIRHFKH